MKYFPKGSQPVVPPVIVELVEEPTSTSTEGGGACSPPPSFIPPSAPMGGSQTWSENIDVRRPIVNEFLEAGNLEAQSRRAYSRALKRFLGWSETPLQEVTVQQISQYRHWLETVPGPRGKILGRSSINQELAAIRSLFNWLIQRYPSQAPPANPVAGIKQRRLSEPEPGALSATALDWIWQTLPLLGDTARRDEAMVHLLMHGLRASEVAALRRASYDGTAVLVVGSKTKANRTVPLSQTSAVAIKQYLEWRQAAGMDTLPDSPLIVSLHRARRGTGLGYKGIYQAIERIGQIARLTAIEHWAVETDRTEPLEGLVDQMPPDWQALTSELAGLHPHQFRHSYATELLRQGLDPQHARRLTGHRSQAAFARYSKAAEDEAAIAAFRRLEQQGRSIVPEG